MHILLRNHHHHYDSRLWQLQPRHHGELARPRSGKTKSISGLLSSMKLYVRSIDMKLQECHGETTAPGTVTIQTAVCSGAAMPTSSTSTASINPGGPITPIPTPSQATSTSCSTFFTQTPGCNSAADNIRECMTTICGSGAPTTVQTSASEMGKCSTEYEVFGASVNTFVSCPPGVSQPTTATSTTERVGIPTCRFCG